MNKLYFLDSTCQNTAVKSNMKNIWQGSSFQKFFHLKLVEKYNFYILFVVCHKERVSFFLFQKGHSHSAGFSNCSWVPRVSPISLLACLVLDSNYKYSIGPPPHSLQPLDLSQVVLVPSDRNCLSYLCHFYID